MSFPNIPDVDASVSLSTEDSVNLLLASVAFEELGLAHMINAEAEKVQYVLGTLEGQTKLETPPTLEDLLKINHSADQTLRDIIKKEMLLQFELEEVLTISTTTTSTTTTTTTTTQEPVQAGSAWSNGTAFGTGNAQYTWLDPEEDAKTVNLVMGAKDTVVGTVAMTRDGDNLLVTLTTAAGYTMGLAHLYADDTVPTDSAPGSFPYSYEEPTPGTFFTTHTFTVDSSAFDGATIFVAAHAEIDTTA